MRTLTDWINEYGESHQNPLNKRIHWICVPAIVFSLVCMLHAISPMLAFITIVACLVFYAKLSMRLMFGALVLLALMWFIAGILPRPFVVGLTVFALAWAGQFYGHYIEGKKPSFFKDLQFLLIGPLWLLHQAYRQRGWPI